MNRCISWNCAWACALTLTLAACGELDLRRPRTPDPGPPDVEVSGAPGKIAATLKIPPGHLPQPGLCRIWKPGAPPGHQSKPGDCAALAARVPPGAWLVMRRESAPGRVSVDVYDPGRAGVVSHRETFDLSTGELIETTQPDPPR